jgi:hypothetical protein
MCVAPNPSGKAFGCSEFHAEPDADLVALEVHQVEAARVADGVAGDLLIFGPRTA